jgi:putative membrane protein
VSILISISFEIIDVAQGASAVVEAALPGVKFAEATMWWWNDYYWHIPWMFGPLVMLFFVALCIGMMVFMMRGGHGGRSNYALDILKERYARGEITKAEYEERRRVLEV